MDRNAHFEHVAATARQETYHDLPFSYNVTKAIEIAGDRAPTRKLDVPGLRNAIDLGRSVDPEHAMTTDISKPLLLANHHPDISNRPLLIDGWHRAYHASEKGVGELDAVELTPEETAQVMYTMRGFEKVKGVMTAQQASRKWAKK